MDVEVINKAIAAHGRWKARLIEAIAKDGEGLDVATISQDNVCEFGKWLYSAPAAPGQQPAHAKVKKLHADFHRVAAEVARSAKMKRRAEAETSMRLGGAYFEASANLVSALMAWKKSA
jgi:hypothetical protein